MDPLALHLYKSASPAFCCAGEQEWLDRFQGTPLFDTALALLQEELNGEANELQSRQIGQQLCSVADQVRLKKRLLELELARLHTVQPTLAPEEQSSIPTSEGVAPGAGTLPSIQQPPGAPAKTAGARVSAGEKTAAGFGTAALNFLRKNPGLAGAIPGAALGAYEGGVPGAALGAVGGAGIGLGAQGAIKSGLKAREIMRSNPEKKLVDVLGRQVSARARNFATDLSGLGSSIRGKAAPPGGAVRPVTTPPPPVITPPSHQLTATPPVEAAGHVMSPESLRAYYNQRRSRGEDVGPISDLKPWREELRRASVDTVQKINDLTMPSDGTPYAPGPHLRRVIDRKWGQRERGGEVVAPPVLDTVGKVIE